MLDTTSRAEITSPPSDPGRLTSVSRDIGSSSAGSCAEKLILRRILHLVAAQCEAIVPGAVVIHQAMIKRRRMLLQPPPPLVHEHGQARPRSSVQIKIPLQQLWSRTYAREKSGTHPGGSGGSRATDWPAGSAPLQRVVERHGEGRHSTPRGLGQVAREASRHAKGLAWLD